MSAIATVRTPRGVDAYLAAVEDRLERTVSAFGGFVAEVGVEALSAGGKRLRPLLVFLATPHGREPSAEAGAAIELVHTATLVHDDLVDRARLRRGRATVWHTFGAEAAKATGDYLFARAFAELASTGDGEAVEILSNAVLGLARGEAMQRRQAHDPDTPIEGYLERCELKTGKLFEAACLLASRRAALGRFALGLGVAFQITDDILDCTGDAEDTGKVPGTDLREGTPTLPLILAAREDDLVRRALAGERVDGALVRVAATGALARSREIARHYATQARELVHGDPELEALTHVVVDRTS